MFHLTYTRQMCFKCLRGEGKSKYVTFEFFVKRRKGKKMCQITEKSIDLILLLITYFIQKKRETILCGENVS